MRFKEAFAGLLIAASTSSAAFAGEPLISEFADRGTMVVNGGEAFYDPSQGQEFDAANSGQPQPTTFYTAEGMVTREVMDGIVYETVTDPSGRIVQGSRAVGTY